MKRIAAGMLLFVVLLTLMPLIAWADDCAQHDWTSLRTSRSDAVIPVYCRATQRLERGEAQC